MVDWWAEEWSLGAGQSRLYCGISRTDDGYAVDVFRGDTCIDSFPCGTRAEAARFAHVLKQQYGGIRPPVSVGERTGVTV